jgi:SAM-dependent methyltransferase
MSIERLREHRRLWDAKPLLRSVYRVWFDLLLRELRPGRRVLEVGAGPGLFSAHARQQRPDLCWVASDILAAPWNDLVADGVRLPFDAAAFDAVTAVDLVHHLAHPAAFFREAARVLAPGGRLAVVEPWVTPLSFPVYRWLHEEGCRPFLDPWNPFGGGDGKDPFEGDAALVWRLVRDTPAARWRELGFAPPRTELLNGFAYLASLGFRRATLAPAWAAQALLALDRAIAPLARALGLRVLAVWEQAAERASRTA